MGLWPCQLKFHRHRVWHGQHAWQHPQPWCVLGAGSKAIPCSRAGTVFHHVWLFLEWLPHLRIFQLPGFPLLLLHFAAGHCLNPITAMVWQVQDTKLLLCLNPHCTCTSGYCGQCHPTPAYLQPSHTRGWVPFLRPSSSSLLLWGTFSCHTPRTILLRGWVRGFSARKW